MKKKEIERGIVFGSKALGIAKPGSDVDCAFSGENLTSQLVSRIHTRLEEGTLLPYFFDCIYLESTQNMDLLDHIIKHTGYIYTYRIPQIKGTASIFFPGSRHMHILDTGSVSVVNCHTIICAIIFLDRCFLLSPAVRE